MTIKKHYRKSRKKIGKKKKALRWERRTKESVQNVTVLKKAMLMFTKDTNIGRIDIWGRSNQL